MKNVKKHKAAKNNIRRGDAKPEAEKPVSDRTDDVQENSYGGMPIRELKKNLGCGG